MSIPRWLKSQRQLAGAHLSFAVGFGLLNGWLLIIQAWLLARIVDGVMFHQSQLDDLGPWLWPMLVIFLLRAWLTRLAEQSAFRGAARVKRALRREVFRHLQALGPGYLTGERSGALVTSLSDGIEALEPYFARFLPAVSLTVLLPLSILAVVFRLDLLSGVVMLVTAPLIPFFMVLVGKGAERLNQAQWQQLARMSARFLDTIQGLTTLKLFNASRREAEIIARASDDYRQSTMKVLRVAFLSALVLEFFSTVSIAVVAVLMGFRLLWGEMAFVDGFLVLLLAPELYLPLRSLGTHYHSRMEAIGAAQQLIEILETPLPERPRHPKSLAPDSSLHIRFEDVHYRYEMGRDALKGVGFEIRPGERLALVGPSGAGKTTVVQLLLGFLRPTAGLISVDGLDLRRLDPEAWWRHLAWVPQRPRLFQGTLIDNIRLGRPDADLESVERAVRLACADEFIERLPAGLATRVGEDGAGLSGGQIQRIALARAFLKDAPLVVLDEATANLDSVSEALVQEAIDALARQRTLLVIAHRLLTVRRADRILVLDDGRLIESGDHDRLLAQDSLYRRMVLARGALR